MNEAKINRLKDGGWVLGDAADFLNLSSEEAAFVEMKLVLSRGLKTLRTERRMTQQSLANRMGSTQSRIAKAEAGDPSITVDLLVRALFATGATRQDLATMLSG
ncbi:MAG: helix-turn-helix transcriptional regulator [Rhodothermia bacterium]